MSRAALLGAVQGATEVLPVSSSAHLVVVPHLLGWAPAPERLRTATAAGLHAGSTAGLLWGLRRDLRALTARDAALLALTPAPAALAGLLLHDRVERRLGSPRQVAVTGALAGVALLLADRRPRRQEVDAASAALAGLAQAVALVPGVSRSGAVLTTLRCRGVDAAAAERFALLSSLPVTAGAAGLALWRARRAARELAVPLALGAPVAAGAALAALRARRPGAPLRGPALYRLGLAVAVVAAGARKG